MIIVEEARARMIAGVDALAGVERVALAQARGRVLAQDLYATRDQPPFAASSMDGYALRAADMPGRVRVIGEIAAGGGLAAPLGAGQAARIFTGAPLPEGADIVLIQENAKRDGEWLDAPAPEPNRNIRACGLDFKAGALLLAAGARLDGIALALAAAAGPATLDVRARPRVVLIANGDEIVAPGAAPGPFQIFDSASFGVAALIEDWGGLALRLPAAGDDLDALAEALAAGLAQADLLVTIGGASVGDHDLVKPALRRLGLDLAVDTVAVRPGKPVFFGTTRTGPVLGLPGNPASALVCAHLFLRPLMGAMLGAPEPFALARARLTTQLPANGPREHYLRARAMAGADGITLVTPAEVQDSSLLSVFRDADALVLRRPLAPAAAVGEPIEIVPLRRG